jgi:hypothetical protein
MTFKKSGFENNLFNSLLKGALATIILTLFFLFYTSGRCTLADLIIALPFFLLFYFAQFTIGRESVVDSLQTWIGKNRWNVWIFPTAMLLLYLVFMIFSHQNLMEGNLWLLLYITFFPVAVFSVRKQPGRKIGWLDFTVFALVLLPGSLYSIKQNSDLPINGSGFDSISHLMIILSGFYAFGVVRGIREIGFLPELKWKSLRTALLVWIAFYSLVFVLGRSVNFIAIIGYNDPLEIVLKSILFTLIGTFLHTALFQKESARANRG